MTSSGDTKKKLTEEQQQFWDDLCSDPNPIRKLTTYWTFEKVDDMLALHDPDIEEELSAALAAEIAAEIDRDILKTLGLDDD